MGVIIETDIIPENVDYERVYQSSRVSSLSIDSSNDSDSDVVDTFEEYHKASFLRPFAISTKKYLSKAEADKMLIESFSDDFKKVMGEIREESGVGDSWLDEATDIEKAFTITKPLQEISQEMIPPEEKILIEKENGSRKSSGSSVESTTWELLRVIRDKQKFEVSSPNFDAFRGTESHWLERPDIPWKVVDKSKAKCEKWLNQAVGYLHTI
nr:unnamed protein product [Callosobruchus chinensis]